jgi:UDP-N-acetyl-2-amino-2-deoxyglucuronate dehydrogenase
MTMRLGLIGGGNISDTHARAALAIPSVELAGVWGHNAARTGKLAQAHGIQAYASLEALVGDASIDGIIVGSPSGSHAEHALAAVRHGKHVLVEKPLDITTDRVDDLRHAARDARVLLGVIFQDRAAPDLQWLRRTLTAGALGELFLATAKVKWYRPPEYYASSRWRGTWALDGGGAVMNQGIHTIDLLLWLLGDVATVYGRARAALHAIEVEDTAVATLEFRSGVLATYEATTAAYPGFARRVEVTGARGTIIIEQDRVVLAEVRGALPEPRPASDGTTTASATTAVVSDMRSHQRVIENFVAAVHDGVPLLCDGDDGRRSVAVVEALYRSAKTGTVERPQ